MPRLRPPEWEALIKQSRAAGMPQCQFRQEYPHIPRRYVRSVYDQVRLKNETHRNEALTTGCQITLPTLYLNAFDTLPGASARQIREALRQYRNAFDPTTMPVVQNSEYLLKTAKRVRFYVSDWEWLGEMVAAHGGQRPRYITDAVNQHYQRIQTTLKE